MPSPTRAESDGPPGALVGVVAVATGALVANLYYAQPLLARIGPELGVAPDVAGSIVSMTQIGYGAGLFFLVSLADRVESRRLVLTTLGFLVLALIGAAAASSGPAFFLAAFVIGLCSSGAQVLIPFIAHLVPDARRGRVVGNIMAGLLTGIMLARPASLFVAAQLGWRAVFWASAVLMVAIGLSLWRLMPRHAPRGGVGYGRILASMLGLLRERPAVRRRALYQVFMFVAFNMLWTAAPIMLAERFGLSTEGIALFALAGAGGALAAPVAGRLADRGLIRATTAGAMLVLAISFLATLWAVAAALMAVLVVATILIDAAVQANQVVSQRVIFAVPSEIRGRVNAIYMTLIFGGGAAGSVLGTATYHWGGWDATALVGALMGAVALALFAAEHVGSALARRRA